METAFLRIVTAVSLQKIVFVGGWAIVQRHILGAGRVNACVADRRLHSHLESIRDHAGFRTPKHVYGVLIQRSRVFPKSPHKERWSDIILTAIDKERGY